MLITRIKADEDTSNIFSSFNFKDICPDNTNDNWAFSPLSYASTKLSQQAYRGDESAAKRYKKLSDGANYSCGDYFSIESNSLVAVRKFEDGIEKMLNENSISTFSGSPKEISKYAADLFGDKAFDTQDHLFANVMKFHDNFVKPLKRVKSSIFHGSSTANTTDYYELNSISKGFLNEEYFFGYLNIRETSMLIFMPLEKKLTDYSINILSTFNESDDKYIRCSMPEWKTKYSVAVHDDNNSTIYQTNEFEFTKNGIKGKSTSKSGPTGMGDEPDIDITIDRPFYYGVYANNIPLMIGANYNL